VVGFIAILMVSWLSEAVAGWGPIADSGNAVLRSECPALVSGVLWLLLALWLFARRAGAGRTGTTAPVIRVD
jgi:hypothetical protein